MIRAVVLAKAEITDEMLRECILTFYREKDGHNISELTEDRFDNEKWNAGWTSSDGNEYLLFWQGNKPRSLYGISEVVDLESEKTNAKWQGESI